MSTVSSENKSRFGYHPCSYELYLKLKYIYKHYWNALSDYSNWERWNRKYPHNRVIRKRKTNAKGQKIGYEIVGPRPEPTYCPFFVKTVVKYGVSYSEVSDFGFNDLFYYARRPSANPVEPFSDLVVKNIEDFHQKLVDYNSK